ncbi:P-loop containing nucleoside triphosphate hydrolase protein [Crucibulum laeve]|uniref:P-loop containing nucleoside triphosphate hydrolase protein n=1 Tax=Crucibulum laeve TaxID=68775 RepID=A0A5C3LUP3_9AGAR|nr:P-loop containing nucleoside triphosphate hydrolase protein [Crucibulum laeve]
MSSFSFSQTAPSSCFSTALNSILSSPVASPQLYLIKHLKSTHSEPELQHISILQCADSAFPLSGYLATIGISPKIVELETHSVIQYDHGQRLLYDQVVAGVTEFDYDSVKFRVYKATWRAEYVAYVFYHLVWVGQDETIGRKLSSAVYTWANSLKEEMWVFENGNWDKSKDLYKAVRTADWDSIVLRDEFKEGLRRDTQTFFGSKDIYTSLGITWKRGILLLGPPGNGKTESIKALLAEFECEALYVKSFVTRTVRGPEAGVRSIFDHARKHAPCVLVLEDLDAMVTSEVRSFFLNELDGLAQNEGILTIATTNHPERIDDAIVNRPSRFDVKYNFPLPEHDLRKEFTTKWIAKIHALGDGTDIKFNDAEAVATEVADKTEGWSFAFLKEL